MKCKWEIPDKVLFFVYAVSLLLATNLLADIGKGRIEPISRSGDTGVSASEDKLIEVWRDKVTGEEGKLAKEIIRSSGIKGGLCVHLGCGDGTLTTELSLGGKFLVHGLVTDSTSTDKVRRYIQSKGNYGQVSVDCGSLVQLPYTENLVNLVVVDNLPELLSRGLSFKEVMRILCPDGVAYLGQRTRPGQRAFSVEELKAKLAASGIKEFEIVKRAGIWAKVRKPRPADIDEWTHFRHGPDGNIVSQDTVVGLPEHLQWVMGPLFARSHAGPGFVTMVSANGRIFEVSDNAPRGVEGPYRYTLSAHDAYNGLLLWKRPIEGKGRYIEFRRRILVAVGERVYTILKQGGPLVALDAATGRIITTYDKAGSPEEVAYYKGNLVLGVLKGEYRLRGIYCLDPVTGELRWKYLKGGRDIVVANNQVFSRNDTDFNPSVSGSDIFCVDLATGKEKWRKKMPAEATIPCFYSKGILFLAHMKSGEKGVHAISAEDGRHLWSYKYKYISGYGLPYTNTFFLGGLVWVGIREDREGKRDWAMLGLDPISGAVKKRVNFPEGYAKNRGHHRCFANKATERYILYGTSGIDFVDWQAEKVYDVQLYRGVCGYGLMPANGLLYLPPNPCQCWSDRQLRGLVALAPARKTRQEEGKAKATKRLVQGAGFPGTFKGSDTSAKDEWPYYRHGPHRSGSTPSELSPNLKLLWDTKVGARVTSPVVAEGMVVVASADAHQILAFDARTGKLRWNYTAGGRVDTPPTIYKGLCLFGSRDGWVYCLKAANGKLIWRFRAAPEERRIGAFGQLESAWPVHGSVLVDNDVAFFAAGRSSNLDGGIYVYAADPRNGKIIWEKLLTGCLSDILAGKFTEGRKEYPAGPGCLSDILVGAGNFIQMRSIRLDSKTGKIIGRGDGYSYLWARPGMLGAGVLRGLETLRVRWRAGSGIARARGELLVFDRDKAIYGMSSGVRKNKLTIPGKGEYKLFSKGAQEWSVQVPVRIESIVLAGKTLFVAGPPDAPAVVDKNVWYTFDSKKVDDYWAAFDGKKGGELWAFSTTNGEKLSEQKLNAPPVFDGMAAAYGRLYISTKDGKLLCMGK